ncbi:MAG: transcription termination/antitermination protein NusG [Clostridia bacterium]
MAEKKWYVIHTYSGYENKVKTNMEKRVESMEVEDEIFRVEVPSEEITEVKNGKSRTYDRKIFPGYVLIEMIITDQSWYVVRNTPGVTGFVGPGSRPVPLEEEEVMRMLGENQEQEDTEEVAQIAYDVGEVVQVIDGPFNNFSGTVEEISHSKKRLKVRVSMFGRETPVELDYKQVKKID